ncbi:MAG: T9SS type A sorting domain-containing protein [Saprospiraceae bacterium]|nr:T9SS type A sorting domain-containing protein [Saprospiraceae bacterium]
MSSYKEIFATKFICLFVLILNTHSAIAQCHQIQLKVTDYFIGQCGNYHFQSSLGTISSVYGNCNKLRFDSPLNSGNQITKVQSELNQTLVEIFPNPTYDKVYFKRNIPGTFKVQLITVLGKQIYTIENPTELDLALLDSGCYIIQVLNEKNKHLFTNKIIKI